MAADAAMSGSGRGSLPGNLREFASTAILCIAVAAPAGSIADLTIYTPPTY